jgi:hypothetical protein
MEALPGTQSYAGSPLTDLLWISPLGRLVGHVLQRAVDDGWEALCPVNSMCRQARNLLMQQAPAAHQVSRQGKQATYTVPSAKLPFSHAAKG